MLAVLILPRLPAGKYLPPHLILCLGLLLVLLAACAPSSGIFSGSGWQSGGLQRQHIRTLAVDPNDPTKIYAGDSQGAIFASTDAGTHWSGRSTGLPLSDPVHMLAFNGNGKKLYVATEKGLFVSSDSAQSWHAITASNLPTDSYIALTVDFSAPGVIYVATATHGIFVTTNDAATWTAINTGLPAAITINGLTYDSDRHQLWAATSAGIYRSDDKGASWRVFNTGLPAGIAVNAVQPVSVVSGAQGLVFAGTAHGFFRSQDGGQHWTTSQEALSGTSVRCILIDFRSTNSSTLYVCTDIGALLSTDSGQTWRAVAPGLPKGQAVYALALGASGYSQIYAATDDVYLYPGNGGDASPTRLIPILLVIVFFYVLYRIASGSRRKQQKQKPSNAEAPASTPES